MAVIRWVPGRACAARWGVAPGPSRHRGRGTAHQRRWRLLQTLHGRATASCDSLADPTPRSFGPSTPGPARRGRPAGRSPPAELAHHRDPRRGRPPRTRSVVPPRA